MTPTPMRRPFQNVADPNKIVAALQVRAKSVRLRPPGTDMVARLSRQTLHGVLRQMDAALDGQPEAPRQTLCVFGVSAVLLYGSDERQTQDIDIWRSPAYINDCALEEMAGRLIPLSQARRSRLSGLWEPKRRPQAAETG